MPDQLGDPPATLGMGQQAQQLELVAQVAVAVVVVEVAVVVANLQAVIQPLLPQSINSVQTQKQEREGRSCRYLQSRV